MLELGSDSGKINVPAGEQEEYAGAWEKGLWGPLIIKEIKAGWGEAGEAGWGGQGHDPA